MKFLPLAYGLSASLPKNTFYLQPLIFVVFMLLYAWPTSNENGIRNSQYEHLPSEPSNIRRCIKLAFKKYLIEQIKSPTSSFHLRYFKFQDGNRFKYVIDVCFFKLWPTSMFHISNYFCSPPPLFIQWRNTNSVYELMNRSTNYLAHMY